MQVSLTFRKFINDDLKSFVSQLMNQPYLNELASLKSPPLPLLPSHTLCVVSKIRVSELLVLKSEMVRVNYLCEYCSIGCYNEMWPLQS